jgi:arabinofuranosyltransferase
MFPPNTFPKRLLSKSTALWFLVLVFVVVVVRSAWLNDDAYITFRTIENFVAGHGLRWNIAERVQTFTHPLWLFLLTIPYAFTREIYFTSLIFSIAVSALTIAVILRWAARDLSLPILVLLILIFSKAFVDYSTSGLENPLTHLLLALFFIRFFRGEQSTGKRDLFWLALLAGLGVLNRFDMILIFGPPLLFAWWRQRSWQAVWLVVAGFLPFILWELFSIFYYGFPFPNTAYAKAFNTGIAESDLWQSGWHYLLNSFRWDPLTLTVIFFGMAAALARRQLKYLLVGLGILLYLLYIVKIGGDFMSGRFLTAPLLAAVLLLINLYPKSPPKPAISIALAISIVALGFQALYPPVLYGGDYGYGSRPEQADWETWHDEDIADERVYYYPYTGLINPNRQLHPWQEQGMAVREEQQPIALHGNVGFFGFFAGPKVHILDRNALGDPLLARLPVANPEEWRVGHLKRDIPEGYIDTLTSGENQIVVPALATYYDRLSLATRGGLTDPQRFREIWWLNSHSEVD